VLDSLVIEVTLQKAVFPSAVYKSLTLNIYNIPNSNPHLDWFSMIIVDITVKSTKYMM